MLRFDDIIHLPFPVVFRLVWEYFEVLAKEESPTPAMRKDLERFLKKGIRLIIPESLSSPLAQDRNMYKIIIAACAIRPDIKIPQLDALINSSMNLLSLEERIRAFNVGTDIRIKLFGL